MLELIAKVTGGVVKCRFYGGGLLWVGFPFNSPLNSSVELQTRHLSSALAAFWRLLRRAASKREFYCDSLCFIHTVCEWMWLSYCSTHCFDHCRWCTSTVQLVIYSLCVGVFFFSSLFLSSLSDFICVGVSALWMLSVCRWDLYRQSFFPLLRYYWCSMINTRDDRQRLELSFFKMWLMAQQQINIVF